MTSHGINSETGRRLFQIAFLTQILVPLLFVADLFMAWRINDTLWWYGFGITGQAIFGLCTIWIITILGLYFACRYTKFFSLSRFQGPLVAVYSIVFIVLIIELFLQVVPQGNIAPALWPPVRQALLEPDPKLFPGVNGTSSFTGNSVGVRGPEITEEGEVYKIVTIGGSTTESLYLDDSEEWPHLIMEGLNENQRSIPVWVGNAGQSGRNTVDHLQLMSRLPIIAEADLIIFLVGLNDFQPTLAFEGMATQNILEKNATKFGLQVLQGGGYPRPTFPIFKRSELFKRTKASSAAAVSRLAPTDVLGRFGVGPGSYTEVRRQKRAEGITLPLPNLKLGLEEYHIRIVSLAQECRANGNRCLFLTQPSIWRDDLNKDIHKFLWFGWVGREFNPKGFVSVSDAALGMELYNQRLLDICEQENLECVDLAVAVPKDLTSFYDDVHFNEGGAVSVANHITDYLLSTKPFSQHLK